MVLTVTLVTVPMVLMETIVRMVSQKHCLNAVLLFNHIEYYIKKNPKTKNIIDICVLSVNTQRGLQIKGQSSKTEGKRIIWSAFHSKV